MRAHEIAPSVETTDRFGVFGGRYVPETLIPALDELERQYDAARADPAFDVEVEHMLTTYVGRPSPLSDAPRLSEHGETRVWLKREDLNQDQQHGRPSAPGAPHGKEADHRGDGRGAARCGYRHGVRALWTRVRRVHG